MYTRSGLSACETVIAISVTPRSSRSDCQSSPESTLSPSISMATPSGAVGVSTMRCVTRPTDSAYMVTPLSNCGVSVPAETTRPLSTGSQSVVHEGPAASSSASRRCRRRRRCPSRCLRPRVRRPYRRCRRDRRAARAHARGHGLAGSVAFVARVVLVEDVVGVVVVSAADEQRARQRQRAQGPKPHGIRVEWNGRYRAHGKTPFERGIETPTTAQCACDLCASLATATGV